MKYLILLLSILIFSCNGTPETQKKMSFGAAAPGYVIDKATGDTLIYTTTDSVVTFKTGKLVYSDTSITFKKTSLVRKPFIAGPVIVSPPVDSPIVVNPPPITPVILVPPGMNTTSPGSGIEQWHDRNDVSGLSGTGSLYGRSDIFASKFYVGETFTVPQAFKNYCETAKQRNAKFSFGIMTFYEDIGNATPAFILNKITKWGNNFPNPNDPIYLAWILDFNTKLNAWIYANNYQDYIGCIDIRHYGNWGEWHLGGLVDNISQVPASMRLTAASGIAIVNAYIKGFPNFQLVALIAAHDRNRLGNTMVDPAISDYVLKASNNFGRIGIRRDHVGIGEDYMTYYMEQAGVKDVWKVAPVTGEPGGWSSYPNYANEVKSYHHNSVGNGNYGGTIPTTQVKTAAAAMGYKLTIQPGSAISNGKANIIWLSNGLVPMYEDWKPVYVFGNIEVPGTTSLKLKYGSFITSDVVNVPAGATSVVIKLRAPGRKDIVFK